MIWETVITDQIVRTDRLRTCNAVRGIHFFQPYATLKALVATADEFDPVAMPLDFVKVDFFFGFKHFSPLHRQHRASAKQRQWFLCFRGFFTFGFLTLGAFASRRLSAPSARAVDRSTCLARIHSSKSGSNDTPIRGSMLVVFGPSPKFAPCCCCCREQRQTLIREDKSRSCFCQVQHFSFAFFRFVFRRSHLALATWTRRLDSSAQCRSFVTSLVSLSLRLSPASLCNT